MIQVKCLYCGRNFLIYPSQLKKHNGTGGRYCSRECRNKAHPHNSYKEKITLSCKICGKKFKVFSSYKNQKCCSAECRHKYQSKIMKDKPSGMLGKKHSIKAKTKMSKVWSYEKHITEKRNKNVSLALRGKNHPNWKGGITPINHKIRESREYKQWRKAVFERDNYTCQICGAKSQKEIPVYLEADHILSFAKYPELRFDVFNGRTLCRECHRKTHNFGVKVWNGEKNT